MSGFFSHLLERHQGETPRVEPRPRSRFEPDSMALAVSTTLLFWEDPPKDETLLARPGNETTPQISPAPRDVAPPDYAPVNSIAHELSAEQKAAPSIEENDASAHRAEPAGVKACPGIQVQPRLQTQSGGDTTTEPPVSHRIAASNDAFPDARSSFRQSVFPSNPSRHAPQAAMSDDIQRHDDMQQAGVPPLEDHKSLGWRVKPAEPPLQAGTPPAVSPERPLETDPPLSITPRSNDSSEHPPTRGVERKSGKRPFAAIPMHILEPDIPLRIESTNTEGPERPVAPSDDPHTREGQLVPPAWLDRFEVEFRRLRDFQRHSRQHEQTINVTIGRVEVRAQGPPAPPQNKSKAKAPTVMSLEDYLKHRQGRGSL